MTQIQPDLVPAPIAWPQPALDAITRRLGILGAATEPAVHYLGVADGVRLRVLDWGGPGAPAFLLHGGALTARTWDYVCVGLRAQFRLIAFDLRGHGFSSWSDNYRLERMAQDIVDAANLLGIPSVHMVGMSLGGVVAAEVASQHASLVKTLALIDVAPGIVFEGTATMREFFRRIDSAGSVEAVVDAAMRANPAGDRGRVAYRMACLLRQHPDGRWVWHRDNRQPIDFQRLLAQVALLDAKLSGLDLPVLLARGARSKALPPDAAHDFVRGLRNGRFVEIPQSGHNVQEDNPAALIAALDAFWHSV